MSHRMDLDDEYDASQDAGGSSSLPEGLTFPSLLAGPLVSSYTYHSVDHEATSASGGTSGPGLVPTAALDEQRPTVSARELWKGKAKVVEGEGEAIALIDSGFEDQEEENTGEEYILGVDEAGRGPVLGPQVYAAAFCKKAFAEHELGEMGFADSKTLTDDRRCELLRLIIQRGDAVKWSVRVMSPADLSGAMLKRIPYNLNAQSHDATINLIRDVLARGFNVTHCFIDTVGPADVYADKLKALFPPQVAFTVTSKADSLFPIVSAASVCAKVTRDEIMRNWKYVEPGLDSALGDLPRGSGYPGDPKTIAYLNSTIDPVFGYPSLVRFSWQTVRTNLTNPAKAKKVVWNDLAAEAARENADIGRFFPGAGAAAAKTQPLWKDLGLVSAISV